MSSRAGGKHAAASTPWTTQQPPSSRCGLQWPTQEGQRVSRVARSEEASRRAALIPLPSDGQGHRGGAHGGYGGK